MDGRSRLVIICNFYLLSKISLLVDNETISSCDTGSGTHEMLSKLGESIQYHDLTFHNEHVQVEVLCILNITNYIAF